LSPGKVLSTAVPIIPLLLPPGDDDLFGSKVRRPVIFQLDIVVVAVSITTRYVQFNLVP
jgi:hypothetical protein